MPKYILIGLGVIIIVYLIMNLWSKLSDKSKNKTIASIFGIIAITFIIVLGLLFIWIMKGTKFQLKVWKYLKSIPKGKIKTYKQVAIGINTPKIPCHRVIRSDGDLGGYSAHGGIKTKKKLLKKEGFSF